MRNLLSLAAVALALAACSAQTPAPPPADPLTEASREAITDYARLLMVEHKPEEAFGKYYADLLVQHDPWIGDGGKGDAEFLRQRREAEPEKYAATDQYVTVVHTMLADRDLVSIVSHVFTSPTDTGREFVDIWRMENGKFAEHWDVIRPIDPANSATVGCGVGGTYAEAVKAGDTVASPACGNPDPGADREANRKLVLDLLAGEPQPGKIERVLADGDIVLVHRLMADAGGGPGTARADLFRVTGGKIADRWTVVQPIPEFSASGRSMTGGPDAPLEPGRVKRAPRPGE